MPSAFPREIFYVRKRQFSLDISTTKVYTSSGKLLAWEFEILDIVLLLFAVLCFIGISPVKGSRTAAADCFSQSQCQMLKGALAVFVLLHHLSQIFYVSDVNCTLDAVFRVVSSRGFYSTAGFLFISGYGVAYQLKSRSSAYLKDFPVKRFSALLVPFVIAFFVYWAYWRLNFGLDIKTAIFSLFTANPIVSNSWFVLALICFYLFFYFTALAFGKRHRVLMLAALTLCWAGYCVVCYLRSFSDWWYNSVHCFVLGVFVALYRERIVDLLARRRFACLAAEGLLIAGLELASFIITGSALYTLLLTVAKTAIFCLFIFTFTMCFKLSSPFLRFSGLISYEFYLIHGLIMALFYYGGFLKYGAAAVTVAVLLLTYLSAYLYNLLDKLILSGIKRLFKGFRSV